jgi:YNFM family putative membrane transporter
MDVLGEWLIGEVKGGDTLVCCQGSRFCGVPLGAGDIFWACAGQAGWLWQVGCMLGVLLKSFKSAGRVSGAFFFAGFGTFALIYDVQPLLAEFPEEFGVAPASASLALSLTTLALSGAMLVAGRVSEVVDRRCLMGMSVVGGGVVSVASAFAPDWGVFLLLRGLLGLALGGLPAVAVAYLADNVPGGKLAGAVGLYVSGTAFGGMAGRLVGGVLSGVADWRCAVGVLGGVCAVAGGVFFAALPRVDSRRSVLGMDGRMGLRGVLGRFAAQWRDGVLARLFVAGGLLLGGFVATFNYLCFRLLSGRFGFSQGEVALVFLMYLAGVVVAPLCGRWIGRWGQRRVLRGAFALMAAGAVLSGVDVLGCLLGGCGLITVGFFAGHATATGWVSRRVAEGKAIASAQYLTVYYLGASVLGWVGGWMWVWGEWLGVAGLVAGVALAGVGIVPGERGEDALGVA